MNFIFLSAIDWDWSEGAHTPTQLGLTLARQGHPILFLQPGTRTPGPKGRPTDVVSLEQLGWSDLQVARACHGLDGGSLAPVAEELVRRVRRLGVPCVAVWFSPFDSFVRLYPVLQALGCRTVYFPLDDYRAMAELGFPQFNLGAERYLVGQVDLVVSLFALADKMRSYGKPVAVLPQIASLSAFQTPASGANQSGDVLRGERTLGFWGAINDRMFDAEAIAFVARARPAWAINLLGAYDSEPQWPSVYDRLKHLPNIRFHGFVPPDQLPGFAERFDVCLMPAPANDFTRGRDPIKVYQYLAAGKPVASLNLPQLQAIPFVENASTYEEFLQAIERAARRAVDPRTIENFLACHTPAAVAGQFVELVQPLLQHTGTAPGSAVPLDTFAEKNQPLEMYLADLEKELVAVRAWALELQAASRRKDQELARIEGLLPLRLLKKLRSRAPTP